MKNALKYLLQALLGFRNYLYVFSVFKVYTLKWDRKENAFLHFLGMLPNEGVLLDIGANLGVMTVLAAKKLDKAQVFAFEPIPQNIEVFKKTVKRFECSNVQLFEIALGNVPGILEMVMPVQEKVKMQGLSHVVHSSIPENNEGIRYTVPVKTLDSISELKNKQVTAIKIDVENFEFFVLKGGMELLRKNKPLIYIELWENENRYNCFELVKQLGYSIQILHESILVPYDRAIHTTQNFFFVNE